jgi:hypothetical protein
MTIILASMKTLPGGSRLRSITAAVALPAMRQAGDDTRTIVVLMFDRIL